MNIKRCLLLICLCTACLRAEEKIDSKKIDALIQGMDSDNMDKRQGCFAELAAIGVQARAALEDAAKNSPSFEVRTRAERLIKVCVPGGAVLNGARLSLTADKTTLSGPGSINLTVTLANLSDKPLVFCEG